MVRKLSSCLPQRWPPLIYLGEPKLVAELNFGRFVEDFRRDSRRKDVESGQIRKKKNRKNMSRSFSLALSQRLRARDPVSLDTEPLLRACVGSLAGLTGCGVSLPVLAVVD